MTGTLTGLLRPHPMAWPRLANCPLLQPCQTLRIGRHRVRWACLGPEARAALEHDGAGRGAKRDARRRASALPMLCVRNTSCRRAATRAAARLASRARHRGARERFVHQQYCRVQSECPGEATRCLPPESSKGESARSPTDEGQQLARCRRSARDMPRLTARNPHCAAHQPGKRRVA